MKVTSHVRSPTCVTPTVPGEDVTEIHLPSSETQAAAAGDQDGLIVKGIRQLRQAAIRAWRVRVEIRGDFHAQGLMGRS